MLGIDAAGDRLEPQEAPDDQPASDEQHERKGDLGDDQQARGPRAMRAAACGL